MKGEGPTSAPDFAPTFAKPASVPSPWNPRLTVSGDTLTGKWRVKINFGMGYPWIAGSTGLRRVMF